MNRTFTAAENAANSRREAAARRASAARSAMEKDGTVFGPEYRRTAREVLGQAAGYIGTAPAYLCADGREVADLDEAIQSYR